MDTITLISLSASIASLVLAIVAISLSIVFFKMSSDLSERTTEAAKDIGASVERLENLFDKLYTDTFTMMRDTVTDMRRYIWPETVNPNKSIDVEVESKVEEKILSLKMDMEQELSKTLHQQKITDENLTKLREQISGILDKAIIGSRKVESEAFGEAIKENVINLLLSSHNHMRKLIAIDIVDALEKEFPIERVMKELYQMKSDGIIKWKGEVLRKDTEIEFNTK